MSWSFSLSKQDTLGLLVVSLVQTFNDRLDEVGPITLMGVFRLMTDSDAEKAGL